MRFFEYQDRARRRLTLLLGLFVLVVVLMVALLNLLLLYTLVEPWHELQQLLPTAEMLAEHRVFLFWTTGLAMLVIAAASLWRLYQLRRAGGGRGIAHEMGGDPVDAEPEDPKNRRLRNIVEEMAIASGLPVPAIFVLERELGINAFAAGFTPHDAAIAVTRGAIESLDRQELKAVVAHEFGHIRAGDMRLNTQLVGILFGIEMIALLGLGMLPGRRARNTEDHKRGPIWFNFALVAAGAVGLLGGRLIRAAIAREQEHRADAHAVQFTRNADGMAGALRKVAARYAGLNASPAMVGHMLFANGAIDQLLATHPPLKQRLERLGQPLDEEALERLGRETTDRVRRAVTDRERRRREQEAAEQKREEEERNGPLGNAFAALPGGMAAALLAALPGELARSARNPHWVAELALYLILHPDPEVREDQLLMILETRGADSEQRVRQLGAMIPAPAPEHRLPLIEMAFPALARLGRDEQRALAGLVNRLIHADGRLSPTEYALGRMLVEHLDGRHARRNDRAQRRKAAPAEKDARHRDNAARYLLATLALHGHPDDPEAAEAALIAGLGRFTGSLPFSAPIPEELRQASQSAAWARILDRALERLARMPRNDRERLLQAMDDTIQQRGDPTAEQRELVRMMAASLHLNVPLPDAGELFDAGH
ncbi:M48 family metalloprotease [Thioalkalivibrio sp. ALJ24]|uniref:M48 family metalloprotease n=1 Tax=Thioalkalivibrio sp. ALJ24 TaxID=545276 RepID=UPI00037E1FC5|nr:M48 family metalloprotease [Thioalkalivibrio sp. ALJ24]